MGCATTTVKISSIVFNVLLAILGIGAIIWIATNPDGVRDDLAIGAYVACALIVVFSILGCFAAIRESVCLTATCAAFLLVLAILQITITCIDLNDRGARSGVATVTAAWDNNGMDAIQKEHECCGKDSPQDYVLFSRQIPPSCYLNQKTHESKNLFLTGCSVKLQEYYEAETVRFAIISWLLIAFELVGFLLAIFLVINFRNKQRRMQF